MNGEPSWARVESPEALAALLQQEAVLLMFGGAHCGVCQALKPKLLAALTERFPLMRCAYIDCADQPDVCAQASVFTLPVVRVYLGGQLWWEGARAFSVAELLAAVERPYGLMFGVARV